MKELVIDDTPVTFQIDWYVFNRTMGAMPEEERARLMASRGEAWHADPEDGDGEDAFETQTVMVGRYVTGGLAVFTVDADGELSPVSINLPGSGIDEPLAFWANPDSRYTTSEMERAGILTDTGVRIAYGPYDAQTRLMRLSPADEETTLKAVDIAAGRPE